jgi:hypothetical protein
MIDGDRNVDLMYAALACTQEGILLVSSAHLCPGYDMRFDASYFARYWQTGGARSCLVAHPDMD